MTSRRVDPGRLFFLSIIVIMPNCSRMLPSHPELDAVVSGSPIARHLSKCKKGVLRYSAASADKENTLRPLVPPIHRRKYNIRLRFAILRLNRGRQFNLSSHQCSE